MRLNTHFGLRGVMIATVLGTLVVASVSALAENREISARRAAERKSFTDAEIADGFFKIAIGAEFSIAGRTDRIRKYDGPVRIFVESRAKPDRRRQVAEVVADIATRVNHLDIAIVETHNDANVTVTLVRNRDLARTINEVYGRKRAKSIQKSLEPQCLSGFKKDDNYRIEHSNVIVVADAGDFIFFDCIYEELLQALGPINDDSRAPWTMFNDDVQKGFFDVYDQYLLNILYDPRIRPGMTADEVRHILPEIMPTVRAFVTKRNSLPK
ncbi:MAG: DUF2927 domain-containing protein [Rhizobiales bacterium]|nr:DUF2927 domain-containing protein [Hyphomicrobiales bacterium]